MNDLPEYSEKGATSARPVRTKSRKGEFPPSNPVGPCKTPKTSEMGQAPEFDSQTIP